MLFFGGRKAETIPMEVLGAKILPVTRRRPEGSQQCFHPDGDITPSDGLPCKLLDFYEDSD